MNSSLSKKVDDYILNDTLGQGQFGKVYLAQNIKTKKQFAVKCVPKSKLKEHKGLVGELLQTETQVLLACQNVNVVKMIKYLESENNCYLIMEYCNQGDFDQFWKRKNKRIPEKEAIDYLKQILNGMKGLHELNVIHRDLKLPNILINDGQLKIGDLGFAKRLNNKDEQVKTALGTLGTMAPEVIEFKSYGLLADMFSLGAIYYQLLFGELPFSTKSYDDFIKDVKSRSPDYNKGGVRISNESQNLLTQMLKYDPQQRMKWNQIYDHPLFAQKDGMQCLEEMTISYILSKQVDMNQNNNLYKTNKALDKISDKNMIDSIRQQQAKLVDPQIVKEEQVQDFDTQKQIQHANQQKQEIDKTIGLYLAKRNTLVFLARVVDKIQRLQHSKNTNVYLPAYMLIKKLYNENLELRNKIKNKENIFKCKVFDQLYNNEIFLSFQKLLEEEGEVIKSHFNLIFAQMKEIFLKMQSPNQQILNELNSSQPSSKFNDNYKNTLLNYYMQLQDENFISEFYNLKVSLLIHILDSICFDQMFKTQEQILQYNPDHYFEQLNKMTKEEKDNLMEVKFLAAFS